jgi:pSer/pThr/pTyr-binding forkhead associated (FHA) protein
VIIGRSDPSRHHNPQIDLGPIDIKNSVSRIHAEIYADTTGWLIQDKGSLNGTMLNGKRLRANEPVRLQPLDQCVFGRVGFSLVDGKLRQVKI